MASLGLKVVLVLGFVDAVASFHFQALRMPAPQKHLPATHLVTNPAGTLTSSLRRSGLRMGMGFDDGNSDR